MKKILIALVLVNILLVAKETTAMQVSDFILDYNSLRGTKVCVHGDIMSMGDMTSINLNTNKLSRNLRKDIMQKCTMMSTCSQVVCGVVQDITYSKGLIVSEIK